MARRWTGNMNGEQYLGNTNKMEVHDLDNEKTNCQIDEIIAAGTILRSTRFQQHTARATTTERGVWADRRDSGPLTE